MVFNSYSEEEESNLEQKQEPAIRRCRNEPLNIEPSIKFLCCGVDLVYQFEGTLIFLFLNLAIKRFKNFSKQFPGICRLFPGPKPVIFINFLETPKKNFFLFFFCFDLKRGNSIKKKCDRFRIPYLAFCNNKFRILNQLN